MTTRRLVAGAIAAAALGLCMRPARADETVSVRSIRISGDQEAEVRQNTTQFYSDGSSDTQRHFMTRELPQYELAGQEGHRGRDNLPTALQPRSLGVTLLVILFVCVIGQVLLNALMHMYPPD